MLTIHCFPNPLRAAALAAVVLVVCFVLTPAVFAVGQMPSAYVEVTPSEPTPGIAPSATLPTEQNAENASAPEPPPQMSASDDLPTTGRNLVKTGLLVFTALCLIGTGVVVMGDPAKARRAPSKNR